MSPRLTRLVAGAVAALILVLGVTYALGRPTTYESSALLVLAPDTQDAETRTNIIESIERSGTVGTHVELLASKDTLRRAGSPDVTIAVRAIPDSRVIRVAAQSGDAAAAKPGLTAVLQASSQLEQKLGDPWSQTVLEAPSEPATIGPQTSFVIGSAVVLALLGALAVLIIMRRVTGGGDGAPARDPWEDGVATDIVTRPRQPTAR